MPNFRAFPRSILVHAAEPALVPAPPEPMSVENGDLSLVRRVQAGERAAYDLLVLKYQHKVVKLVMRYVRNPADAEDIAQEAFIKAYRALPQFRGDSAFYTWLYRIAINTAKNALVSRDRSLGAYEIDAHGPDENPEMASRLRDPDTPEGLALSDEIRDIVNAAIAELPDDLRTAIMLRELEGLSYDEIASAMQCPVGTVRSRIFRAREAIDKPVARSFRRRPRPHPGDVVNQDERASQLSAMFDGELPAAECELLSRRLARDEQLRATWSRYAVIGAVLRAEPLAQVRPDFARRVSAGVVGPGGGRARGPRRRAAQRRARDGDRRGRGWRGHPAAAQRHERHGGPGQPLVAAATTPATVAPRACGDGLLASLASIPSRLGRLNWRRAAGAGAANTSHEDFSYVVPPMGNDNNLAVPASLADYVVAHSEVSSSLARGNLLSVLVGNEALQPAPDTMLTDGRQ